MIAFALMISVFTFYLVKTTVESTFQSEDLYSIGLRIFMNYCQVIYLCLLYKIAWPGEVIGLTSNNGSQNGGDGNESGSTGQSAYFFSFKCLINSNLEEIDVFYYRVYFMISVRVILFIGSLAAIVILKVTKIVHDIKYYKSVIL